MPTTEVGEKISSCNSTTARSVVVVAVLLIVIRHISIKLQTEHPYMMLRLAPITYVHTYSTCIHMTGEAVHLHTESTLHE